MKKISYVLLPLLLVLSVGLSGCISEAMASDNGATAGGADNNLVFTLTDKVLSLPDNPPYNYQVLIEIRTGKSFDKGETVTMEMTATSDVDIAMLKTALIDQGESGSDWKNFTNYYEIYSSIFADEEFSFSFDLPVDTSTTSDNLKIALFTEYDSVVSQPTLTIKSLTLTKSIKMEE